MPNRLVSGIAAGAAGTVALNVATYLDMLVRGRPASELPARVAAELADMSGVSLDFERDASAGQSPSERERHRHEAAGALLGYANGLGLGLGYGLLRLIMPRPPLWLAGGFLGSLAMAASDIPATRLGLTRPQEWSTADWAADVLPHAAYGLATAVAFELLTD